MRCQEGRALSSPDMEEKWVGSLNHSPASVLQGLRHDDLWCENLDGPEAPFSVCLLIQGAHPNLCFNKR